MNFVFGLIGIIVLLALVWFTKSAAKIKHTKDTINNSYTEPEKEYLFSAEFEKGKIIFSTLSFEELFTKTHCFYIPLEVSDRGIKPLIDGHEQFITDKMIKNLEYYYDTSQKYKVFCEDAEGKKILYSNFPLSYAFEEVEDDIKTLISDILKKAVEEECKEITLPLHLSDRINLNVKTYIETLIEPIEAFVKDNELNVILFNENERFQWQLIDSL